MIYLKWSKGKTYNFYPKRISFRFGEIRNFTNKQKLKFEHQQTNFTTNVKELETKL